jgi:uncharacterized protein
MNTWHNHVSEGSARPGVKAPASRSARALLVLAGLCAAILCMLGTARAESVEQVAAQAKSTGYVTDLAGVMSQPAKAQLTALLTEVAQKTQAEIVVVTIHSLDGRPVEEYSLDLADRLGLGPKGAGRGVLILFAIDDHRDRVETGYALEPILPDGKTGGFQREIVPLLRAGNYDAGISLLTRRVADVIAADKGVTLTGAAPPIRNMGQPAIHVTAGEIFLIIVFFIFIIRMISRASMGGRPGRGGGWWIGPMIGGGWGGGGFGGGGGGGGGGFGGFGGGGFGGGSGFGGGGSSGSW